MCCFTLNESCILLVIYLLIYLFIYLLVRPKITKLVPSTKFVIDGSTVDSVVCIAEGYPKPSINWKIGANIVITSKTTNEYSVGGSSHGTGRNLTLGMVAVDQNGEIYTCEASNSAGSDTSTFNLTVTCKMSCETETLFLDILSAVDAKITLDPQTVDGTRASSPKNVSSTVMSTLRSELITGSSLPVNSAGKS